MHENDTERRDELPEHEFRDIEQQGDVGAGVMSTGGTATDRGTGTLGGVAQGDDEISDAGLEDGADLESDREDPGWLATPAVASHPEIDPMRTKP